MHTEYTSPVPAAQQVFSEAEIIPFDRKNVPAVREEYNQALRLWFQTRDVAQALTREEIGALDKFARVDAQRKAIILSLAHYYRKHPRADVGPGVAVVLTLLSDNDKGAATISQPTLAKLFDRSRSAIADAQGRLRDDGIIVTSRGRYAATYPVIPRAVTTSYNHLTWLIEAVCDQDQTPNVPASPYDCQSTGQPLRLDQSSGGSLPLTPVNRSVEDASINRPDPTLLHLDNSKEERGSPREGAFGKIAAAVGLTMASAALPLAAAPHPVAQVMQDVAECWQTQEARQTAALNQMEAKAQRQVWLTPSGGLEISGHFKAEMASTFPLVDMASALAAACPNVKAKSGALAAFQVIRRQFGYMQQDAVARQRRAASYGKPAAASPGEKPADMPQVVWDKIVAARAAKERPC